MLTLEEIKEKVIPIAEKYEIPVIYLFGSYAKGTFLEKNKIDIVYNASYSKAAGKEKLSLQEDLEKVLEIPVNLLRIKNGSFQSYVKLHKRSIIDLNNCNHIR